MNDASPPDFLKRLKARKFRAMELVFKAMSSPPTDEDLRKLRRLVRNEPIETVDRAEVDECVSAFLSFGEDHYTKKGTTKAEAALNLATLLIRVRADLGMQIGLGLLHSGDLKGEGGPDLQLAALREYKIPRSVLLRLLEETPETPEEKTA